MDLKALIAKMDQIESKRFLTEDEDRIPAKKKETSWTDKSGKKHPATQVQGHQSRKADKEAEKESKKDEGIVFRSAIGQELLKEFGLNENPFQRLQAWHQKNTDALAAKEKEEAAMSDPANIEAFRKTLTPSQLKWVGGANLGDPIIRSRIPPPQPGEKPGGAPAAGAAAGAAAGGAAAAAPAGAVTSSDGKPVVSSDGKPVQSGAAAGAGGQAASPAKPAGQAAPAGVQAQGDDEGNTTITRPDGTTMVVGPDGNAIKPGSNPNLPQNKQAAKEKEYAANADAEDQAMGAAMTANAQAAAGGQAASPAKPAGGTQVQTDDDGNHMITTPDGKTSVVGPDGKPLPNGGRVTPAAGGQTAGGQSDTGAQNPPAAGGQAAAPAPAGGSSYQIKPGDTLGKIAAANGTTVQAIMAANPQIKDANKIAAGAKLNLPGGAAGGAAGGQAASPAKPGGITPGQNARDDLLARQGRSSTGVNAQGQNVTITNPDGSTVNPETGQRTAAAGGQSDTGAQNPPAAGGQAASPAAPQKGPNGEPAVRDPRTGKMGYMKRQGRTQSFVPFPEAGQAASPQRMNLPGKAVPGAGNIGDNPMPESRELARIKSLISYRW